MHFPRSCLHCDDAPCVTVCPTGASYKRADDGIVLVNEDACIGCGLCAWACPYGARELDAAAGVMKKCTLCVDRIDNATLPEADRVPACVRACPTGARHFGDLADPESAVSRLVAERGGYDLMPEQGTRPVNKYLPPRPRDRIDDEAPLAPLLDIRPDRPRRLARPDAGAALMHPAPSVILFTVLSGAGFGLLAMLGLGPALGAAPQSGLAALLLWGLGYALAGAGLLASAFHLGQPERALRAFSQWRTQLAVARGLGDGGSPSGARHRSRWQPSSADPCRWPRAPSRALICLATVLVTAMIYAQLKTVPRWNHWTVPALFAGFALTGGAILAGLGGLGGAAGAGARRADDPGFPHR